MLVQSRPLVRLGGSTVAEGAAGFALLNDGRAAMTRSAMPRGEAAAERRRAAKTVDPEARPPDPPRPGVAPTEADARGRRAAPPAPRAAATSPMLATADDAIEIR